MKTIGSLNDRFRDGQAYLTGLKDCHYFYKLFSYMKYGEYFCTFIGADPEPFDILETRFFQV